MPEGAIPTCDSCGGEIPALGPQFRLSHMHLVAPYGSVGLVTGFPEQDIGIFCSKHCLRKYVDQSLGDD
jgi:hypothetical protein